MIYSTLLQVVAHRKAAGQGPRPIIVVTDIAKDYDDLAALALLKELHRLELVTLRAVITNLMPENKRARFARGALDALGLSEVPVGCGTCGSPDTHVELEYEFDCPFMADASTPIENGEQLLRKTYRAAEFAGEKLTVLCLSSLRDLSRLAERHRDLVANNTAEVHMQGGNRITASGTLEPDPKAANNKFDLTSATAWHAFLHQQSIPSYTYTKAAAYNAALPTDVFDALADTGHAVGAHLRRVQRAQDIQFYRNACDPQERFMPHMDQAWFLRNRSSWHDKPHAAEEPLPTGDAIVPYLTKVIVYDALAALGAAGQDATDALKVFIGEPRQTASSAGFAIHTLYGSDEQPGIHASALTLSLRALLKGSLWAAQEQVADLASLGRTTRGEAGARFT